jgi:hypothetical protein
MGSLFDSRSVEIAFVAWIGACVFLLGSGCGDDGGSDALDAAIADGSSVADSTPPDSGGVPPLPSLMVSASSITQGDPLTVTWTSTNAQACAASGTFPGWSGTKSPAGNETLPTTANSPTGELAVELTCSNAIGASQTAVQTVTVSENGGDPCSGDRAPPPGMTRAVSCDLFNPATDCTSYASVFNGIPGTTGIRQIAVAADQYLAMRLDPATIPAEASVDINLEGLQAHAHIKFGQPLWSISTCPGDFNQSAIAAELGDSDCILDGAAAKFGFKFGGSEAVSQFSRCGLSLPPGTVYYLNLVWTNDPAGTPNSDITWQCGIDGSECGAQFQAVNISGW